MTSAKSSAILVLGMHRSGTSAVARMLNLLGAELGTSLLEAGYSNEKGFWEHRKAYELDDQLLQRLGLSWHDLRELPADWRSHPAAKRAEVEIRELIAAEFSDCPLWAIKEPRMCRLAPLWIDAVAAEGVQPKALIVLRDPREVAASLRVRDRWAAEHTHLLWLRHVMEAELATRHIPRCVVSYDDLLRDWRNTAQRIGQQLGITWPRTVDDAGSDIAAYLDHGERNHGGAGNSVDTDAPPDLLLRLYELGRRAQHDKSAAEEFSAMIEQFRDFGAVYAGGIADLTRYGEEQEAIARNASQWLDVARPALEEARAGSAKITAMLAEANAQAAAWRDGLWHTLTDVATKGRQDFAAQLDADRQNAEAHRQSDRQHAEAWRDGLWHALIGLIAQGHAKTNELLESDRAAMREERERGELQRLRAELDARTEQLQASAVRSDALQRKLDESEARERASTAELSQLHRRLERGLLRRLFGSK